MADINIDVTTGIEGLDELDEALSEGSKRTSVKFLRSVEMKAANVLVKSAEEYAPYETGHLEGDIHRQSVIGDGTVTVRVGPGKETFYGQFQEFGAPEINVPALHWLENSARDVQDEVLEAFCENAEESLEKMKK